MSGSYHKAMAEQKPYFRQNHPKAQQVCTIMGLEGNILNLKDGILPNKESIQNLELLLNHLKELTPYMPETW